MDRPCDLSVEGLVMSFRNISRYTTFAYGDAKRMNTGLIRAKK